MCLLNIKYYICSPKRNIQLNMSNTKSEFYTEITPSVLHSFGGNTASMSGVSLFDTVDNEISILMADIPFLKSLLKLKSEIIIICIKGSMTYMMDCNSPIVINSGEIVIFNEGQIIEFIEAEPDCKLILLSLPHDIALRNYKDWHSYSYPTIITPKNETLDEIHSVYQFMRNKMDNPSFSRKEEIIYSYMNTIILNIHEAFVNKKVLEFSSKNMMIVSNRQKALYDLFIGEVKKHFTLHRDVKYYASALSLSPGHLSRIVKSVSGKTVSEWIKDYVILEAKVMLRSKDLAIFQISDKLNFANPSFFSKYFREREGITPTQYRNKYL